ncbi:MAG: CTP synthase C-terminal region-related (seleno)protein [Acidobacteriaceae bacterium]
MATMRVGIIGDYDRNSPTHLQTDAALSHTATALGVQISSQWLPTDETHDLALFDALWCAPGSPYKSLEGALVGIRFARENRKSLLGTCGGFQHIVLEYARNVMGIEDAAHAEYDPYASHLFVQPLSCSLKGKTMPVQIKKNSFAARAYGTLTVEESYYCNFGLNPSYQQKLHDAGLHITGWDADGEARIVELPDSSFYVGTLFVPQSRSAEGCPHPLIRGFVEAAL